MNKPLKNAGEKFTIEICQMYHEQGIELVWTDGRDVTLISKKMTLSDGRLNKVERDGTEIYL